MFPARRERRAVTQSHWLLTRARGGAAKTRTHHFRFPLRARAPALCGRVRACLAETGCERVVQDVVLPILGLHLLARLRVALA